MSIKSFYAKIDEQLDQKLPFVVYCRANSDVIEVFFQQNDNVFEIENYDKASGFVFAPFDSSQKAIVFPLNDSVYDSFVVKDELQEVSDKVVRTIASTTKNSQEQEKHMQLVSKGVDAIKSGHFEKVVLSRSEETERSATVAPLEIFKKIVKNYDTAFCYLWYHPKVGMWLGATPETLLHCNAQQFTTMALAGTQPYKTDDLVYWAGKELEEQEIVSKFILDGLTPVTDDLEVSETYTHRAGSLLHLRTDIKGRLNLATSGLEDVIKILHPTPAVCGLPKEEAKMFILNNEKYDRKYYTGFLGELQVGREKNQTSLFVNLRCMELMKNKAILYIGGGITKDSNPYQEWEETIRKTETMKKVLF